MPPENQVSAESARVWRGYASVERDEFERTLADTFIPVTVQMMEPLGLRAYLPALLPKHETLPDEIALVFYKSQAAYTATRNTPIARVYGPLHKTIFRMSADGGAPKSVSSFPSRWQAGSALEPGVPKFVFGNALDWQEEGAAVFAGRYENEAFLRLITAWASADAAQPKPKECIFVWEASHLLLWTHWGAAPPERWYVLPETGASAYTATFVQTARRIQVSTRPGTPPEQVELAGSGALNVTFAWQP
jgi:hypothetical protein